MVTYACSPSIEEAEAGECEFEVSLGYIVRLCFKKKKRVKYFITKNSNISNDN
jgi:hypothetical protein